MTRLALAFLIVLAGGRLTADAQPPADADPALHDWFESLRQPGTGMSCCAIADCRTVDYRLGADGYEAFLDEKWVAIPGDTVIRGISNPTMHGVLCRAPRGPIRCFVPGSET